MSVNEVTLSDAVPGKLDNTRVTVLGWERIGTQVVVTFRLPDTHPRSVQETAPGGRSGSIVRAPEGGTLDVGTSRWEVVGVVEANMDTVADMDTTGAKTGCVRLRRLWG
jgi:hypothetical protein